MHKLAEDASVNDGADYRFEALEVVSLISEEGHIETISSFDAWRFSSLDQITDREVTSFS